MAVCDDRQSEVKRCLVDTRMKKHRSLAQRCRDVIPPSSSWYAFCRLLACIVNIVMIVGMYLEYLWAANWDPIPAHCEDRGNLPWLDFCNCMHRYTFSHAMLRGQNLQMFAVFGTFVAVCFLATERKRLQRLQCLLDVHLDKVAEDAGLVADTQFTLRLLPIYSMSTSVAFIGVLGLAPFHLNRPMLHYGCAGTVAGCMLLGVCTYVAMPLGSVVGLREADRGAGVLDQSSCSDDLVRWAQRHKSLCRFGWVVIALHFVLPASVALHHLVWIDTTGRIFGVCEVLTILSYQFFVAILACDDFATQTTTQPASTAKEAVSVKDMPSNQPGEDKILDAAIGG